jgi:hypothetical protein
VEVTLGTAIIGEKAVRKAVYVVLRKGKHYLTTEKQDEDEEIKSQDAIAHEDSGITVTKKPIDDDDIPLETIYETTDEYDVELSPGDLVKLGRDVFTVPEVMDGGGVPRRIAAALFCVFFALSGALLS